MKLVWSVIQDNIRQYAIPQENLLSKDVKFVISVQLYFQVLKIEIRGKRIQFCSQKKRQCIKIEENLENDIQVQKIKVDTGTVNLSKNLKDKQEELEKLQIWKLKEAMVRSKTKYYELGEKPTKYFCNLKKKIICLRLLTG